MSVEQLAWLRDWIGGHPDWSRKRLARELCGVWQWRDDRGRLKDFAARSFLLKMEARGQVELPPLQTQKRRPPRGVEGLWGWQEPEPWQGSLPELRPVQVEVALWIPHATGAAVIVRPIGGMWGKPPVARARTGTIGYRLLPRPFTSIPCAGTIVLKSCRGYSVALGRWVNPTRERWGLKPKQRLSPELQSRPGFTATVDFGAAVHAEARRRGLARARRVYVLMDGAPWLWNVAQDRFSQAIQVLDFHHASEHLWAIAHHLHGEGTDAARAWAQALLHQLRHGQETQVVHSLEALLQEGTALSANLVEALETSVEYFRTHREHTHYQRVARQGGPIGSGSVESLCSQLQDRFKRTGQFWSPSGLENLLWVEVFVRNQDFDTLWN